jgi:hypothetical protein
LTQGIDPTEGTTSEVAEVTSDLQRPQGDTEVSAPAAFREFAPVCEVFPLWLGGMTQEEAGLTLMLVATA